MPDNPNYNLPQPHQPGSMAPYLLGMGEMPPPRRQDFAVAMANHLLDNQNQVYRQVAGAASDSDEENIDPQLRGLPQHCAAAGTLSIYYICLHYLSVLAFSWSYHRACSSQQQSHPGH